MLILVAIASSLSGMTVLASPLFEGSDLINVERDIDGLITLKGPNCQELTEQVKALENWKIKLGGTPGQLLTPLENSEENNCQIIINNSIPNIIKHLQGFKATSNGPNCWNSALRLSEIIHFFRHVSSDEMTFWLSSPYCKELSESERKLPGDIVEIRSMNPEYPLAFEEIHGMIYITDELVFSKNTSSRMSPYGIQRSSLIYQSFRVDNLQCKNQQDSSGDCSRWINYYRCHSADKDRIFYEKINNKFSAVFFELEKIEFKISKYVFEGKSSSEFNKIIIGKQLNDIEIKISNEKISGKDMPFFWQALYHEINSLKTQMKIIGP